jgi:predicted nucleotidyltransferase
MVASMKQIRDVAQRIGREFHPEKVILFGSYASGVPKPDSDVDLLVIMPFRGNPVYKSVEIALRVHAPFAMDLLVRTPREVQKRLDWNDCFMRQIVDKGKVLYAANNRRMGGQGGGRLRRAGARVSRPKKAGV